MNTDLFNVKVLRNNDNFTQEGALSHSHDARLPNLFIYYKCAEVIQWSQLQVHLSEWFYSYVKLHNEETQQVGKITGTKTVNTCVMCAKRTARNIVSFYFKCWKRKTMQPLKVLKVLFLFPQDVLTLYNEIHKTLSRYQNTKTGTNVIAALMSRSPCLSSCNSSLSTI